MTTFWAIATGVAVGGLVVTLLYMKKYYTMYEELVALTEEYNNLYIRYKEIKTR